MIPNFARPDDLDFGGRGRVNLVKTVLCEINENGTGWHKMAHFRRSLGTISRDAQAARPRMNQADVARAQTLLAFSFVSVESTRTLPSSHASNAARWIHFRPQERGTGGVVLGEALCHRTGPGR